MMMARKKSTKLTENHKRILGVIDRYTSQYGYPPSIREICKEAVISSTSVANYYLDRLEELGYIERDRKVSRGLRLIKPLYEEKGGESGSDKIRQMRKVVSELIRIPVVGSIVASEPAPVPESRFSILHPESAIDVAMSLLPGQKVDDLFALEVRGDSMIDAMVNDGDIVIMRKVYGAVKNGDMVAIWLNDRDETTLKYFYKEKDRIRLQPANPTMEPIYIDDPMVVEIQGKVVMVVRQMETQ